MKPPCVGDAGNISLMTTAFSGSLLAGSAEPGEPPIFTLAAQAWGSPSPYEGRAKTSECAALSAVAGQGGLSEYFTSNRTAPDLFRSRMVPESFGMLFVPLPIGPK